MENTYKNLCTSELYIKSIGKMIPKKGTFECEDNDEMKKLVKDSKVVNYGKDAKVEEPKSTKSTKKSRKKNQPSESEGNSEQEDDEQTNTGGGF